MRAVALLTSALRGSGAGGWVARYKEGEAVRALDHGKLYPAKVRSVHAAGRGG